MRTGARGAAVVVCAVCLVGLAGCAAVKVTRADGSEQVSIHPLGLGWDDRPTDGLQYISAQSFGVSRSAKGFDVGFRREDVVLAPASCQAVFVIHSEQQQTAARALAREAAGQCVVRR